MQTLTLNVPRAACHIIEAHTFKHFQRRLAKKETGLGEKNRNVRRRNISSTIGVIIAFGCSLLLQIYEENNMFV